MHSLRRRMRPPMEAPSDHALVPLGEARFERLAWIRPSVWQDTWQLESERGVHAVRWPVDHWKGLIGVRFADAPELRLRTSWKGVHELTVAGDDTVRLEHHADWLGHAEWRRNGATALRWRRTSMAGHRLEESESQPLLHIEPHHEGWLRWSYTVRIEDRARRCAGLGEWLAMAAYVAMGGGAAAA